MAPGREQARFEAFYRQHYEHLLAYALRRSGPQEAEDIVAEAFLTAWRRFRELPDDSLPWLYSVARRILGNHLRSGRRRQILSVHLQRQRRQVGISASDDPAEHMADRAEIFAAFAQLSAMDREVLSLVAWEELSHERAATAMNCSPATFAVRLHRARRRLARALATVRSDSEASGAMR